MTRPQLVFAVAGWIAFAVVLPVTRDSPAVAESERGRAEAAVSPTCPADVAPPGGDGVVNVTDLLQVLADWGACPDCIDGAEPNDTCGSVAVLAPLESSGPNQNRQSTGKLDVGELDLYRFGANETDSSCSCCDPLCFDEDFLVTVTLAVPISATGPLVFRVDSSCTTDTTGAVAVAPGISDSISFWVDGDCTGPPNAYAHYILVAGADGTVFSCDPYTLDYSFSPGCEGQP